MHKTTQREKGLFFEGTKPLNESNQSAYFLRFVVYKALYINAAGKYQANRRCHFWPWEIKHHDISKITYKIACDKLNQCSTNQGREYVCIHIYLRLHHRLRVHSWALF